MKRICILAITAALAFPAGALASSIYSLIVNGELDEAGDSLSQVSTAAMRDGNMLFYASLLETDADQAARLMRAALDASVSAMHREHIYYRLAQYYFIQGDSDELNRIVAEYMALWETGRHRRQMQRFSTVVDEQSGDEDAALRQADRYLLYYDEGDWAQWGEIDKARILLGGGKDIGAGAVLRRLSKDKSGPGVPQALYLLALYALAEGDSDDAVFYYNMLRESYPDAVGLEALRQRLRRRDQEPRPSATPQTPSSPGVPEAPAASAEAPTYSVQVGVFSIKRNAERQADTFSKYGYPVSIERTKFSRDYYHVVYVGEFSEAASATQLKAELEQEHREVFPVVTR